MRPGRVRADRSGFTLTELLTVFVIVGTLAGIVVPTLRGAVQRADAAHVVADARNIEIAVRTYVEDTGTLPATTNWGEAPPELADVVGTIAFVYESCEYRLLSQPGTGVVRLRVRYPNNDPIGLALQAHSSPGRVVWTSTRTDFYLLD